ncbi:MAG: hypothetical protein M3O34_14040, partial [Chloroflexota bacterium]|nr:hypothetical protein [Chloroflexota bacterium]
MQYVARVRRAAALGTAVLAFGLVMWTSPVQAQGVGCRSELGRESGARVTAQLVRPAADGQPASADPPTTELEARSG